MKRNPKREVALIFISRWNTPQTCNSRDSALQEGMQRTDMCKDAQVIFSGTEARSTCAIRFSSCASPTVEIVVALKVLAKKKTKNKDISKNHYHWSSPQIHPKTWASLATVLRTNAYAYLHATPDAADFCAATHLYTPTHAATWAKHVQTCGHFAPALAVMLSGTH